MFKFTRTLPPPIQTHGGFVFHLSTGWFTQADGPDGSPIDGGVNSILNGGGNLRAYTDDTLTTRLPVHVVEFVTGLSPSADVKVRLPSYTIGATITIVADDTETTQPPVTNQYGRNAVWQDYIAVYLFDGNANDSTGDYDGTVIGATYTGTGYEFVGTDRIELPDAVGDAIASNHTINYVVTHGGITGGGNQGHIFDTRVGADTGIDIQIQNDEHKYSVDVGVILTEQIVVASASSTPATEYISCTYDNSNVAIYSAGLLAQTLVQSGPASRSTTVKVGNQANDGDALGAGKTLNRITIDSTGRNSGYIFDSYQNESDPDNFGVSSVWSDGAEPTYDAAITESELEPDAVTATTQRPAFSALINEVEVELDTVSVSFVAPQFSATISDEESEKDTVTCDYLPAGFNASINESEIEADTVTATFTPPQFTASIVDSEPERDLVTVDNAGVTTLIEITESEGELDAVTAQTLRPRFNAFITETQSESDSCYVLVGDAKIDYKVTLSVTTQTDMLSMSVQTETITIG